MFGRLDAGIDGRKHVLHVGDNAEIHRDILADGAGIAVHMDDLGALRVRGELAGDTVGKPHAESDDEISLVDGVVRRSGSVHSCEPQRERVVFVEGAEPHKRRRHGNLRLMRQIGDVLGRAGRDHAAAGIQHGTPGLVHKLREARHLRCSRHGLRMVGAERDAFRILRGCAHLLDVLRYVDHNRTWLAVRGDIECLGDSLRNLVRTLDEEAVLCDGAADAAHVSLLESICADLRQRHLARDAH